MTDVKKTYTDALNACRDVRNTTVGVTFKKLLEATVVEMKEEMLSVPDDETLALKRAVLRLNQLLKDLSLDRKRSEVRTGGYEG